MMLPIILLTVKTPSPLWSATVIIIRKNAWQRVTLPLALRSFATFLKKKAVTLSATNQPFHTRDLLQTTIFTTVKSTIILFIPLVGTLTANATALKKAMLFPHPKANSLFSFPPLIRLCVLFSPFCLKTRVNQSSTK